jgi:ribosomal protein S18 acetylase RimI-like enzyme
MREEIRALSHHTDVEEFVRLRSQSFRRAPLSFAQDPDLEIDVAATREEWARTLGRDHFILGYFVGAQLAGIVGFSRCIPAKRSHRGFVWGFYVDAAFQGRGIGRRLMEALIERAAQIEGLEKIYLTVSDHATAALALYHKLGFTEFGREPDAARTGDIRMAEIYLSLSLAALAER